MSKDEIANIVFLVLGLLIFSKLAVLAKVRSSRGTNFDWFKNMRGSINKSLKTKDDSLDELHRRVEALKNSDEKE